MKIEQIKEKYLFDAPIVSRKTLAATSRVKNKYKTPEGMEKSYNRATAGFGSKKQMLKNAIDEYTNGVQKSLNQALKSLRYVKLNADDSYELSNAAKTSINSTIQAVQEAVSKSQTTLKFLKMSEKSYT